MLDWQNIIRTATTAAGTAKWRDYALARLPEVSGWTVQKPRALGGGDEATYSGKTKAGIPLKVTVNKGRGVWRVESGEIRLEDDIDGLEQQDVELALSEAAETVDQKIQEQRRASRT